MNGPVKLERCPVTDGLQPCPLCGSREHLFVEPDERGSGGQWVSPIHVGCCQWKGCGVAVTGDDTEEATAKWNTRAMHQASRIAEGIVSEEGEQKQLSAIVNAVSRVDHFIMSDEAAKAVLAALDTLSVGGGRE
jgi:hypothetical protein